MVLGNVNLVFPRKSKRISRPWPELSRGHVSGTGAGWSPELRVNKQDPPSQYMAVKTFYIDMSSRFTAPHCLSYYQAINSTAGMNWLTLRVAGVVSCNLIPYIILSVSPLFYFYFFSHMHVVEKKRCIYPICRLIIIKDHLQNTGTQYCGGYYYFNYISLGVVNRHSNKCSCGAQVAWPSLLPSVTAPSRWAALNNSCALRICPNWWAGLIL